MTRSCLRRCEAQSLENASRIGWFGSVHFIRAILYAYAMFSLSAFLCSSRQFRSCNRWFLGIKYLDLHAPYRMSNGTTQQRYDILAPWLSLCITSRKQKANSKNSNIRSEVSMLDEIDRECDQCSLQSVSVSLKEPTRLLIK